MSQYLCMYLFVCLFVYLFIYFHTVDVNGHQNCFFHEWLSLWMGHWLIDATLFCSGFNIFHGKTKQKQKILCLKYNIKFLFIELV